MSRLLSPLLMSGLLHSRLHCRRPFQYFWFSCSRLRLILNVLPTFYTFASAVIPGVALQLLQISLFYSDAKYANLKDSLVARKAKFERLTSEVQALNEQDLLRRSRDAQQQHLFESSADNIASFQGELARDSCSPASIRWCVSGQDAWMPTVTSELEAVSFGS